jgi:hypothetical protein
MTDTMTDAATIAPNAHDIASAAADYFRRRDDLAAELAWIDQHLKHLTRDYGTASRVWGLTPLMLRHACEARGLLDKRV